MKVLNLGCGNVVVDSWINIDLNVTHKNVIKMNFLKKLSFSDNSIDVVYLSHVLEHVAIEEVPSVVSEIFRVLRPGGIVRIVVPDLENLAKEYLTALEIERLSGRDSWKRLWLTIELLDQLTRNRSGGIMKIWYRNIASQSKVIADYVFFRVGEKIDVTNEKNAKVKNWFSILATEFNINQNKHSRFSKDKVRKGEKHLWMWDELSLKELSEMIGFREFSRRTAFTSELTDFFNRVDLDNAGNPRKGSNSIYVEFKK